VEVQAWSENGAPSRTGDVEVNFHVRRTRMHPAVGERPSMPKVSSLLSTQDSNVVGFAGAASLLGITGWGWRVKWKSWYRWRTEMEIRLCTPGELRRRVLGFEIRGQAQAKF